jgi:glutaryl-CoA dehydrogenase
MLKSRIPKTNSKGLADIGGFTYIPEEYGGAGLDQISYGLCKKLSVVILVLILTSVQSSLVMYPYLEIW